MSKIQKDSEQRLRLMKFDCEMRAKSVEIASKLITSYNIKSLLKNSEKVAKYIFGMPNPPKGEK